MDEPTLCGWGAGRRDRLPPLLVGDLHDPAAETLDCGHFRLGRAFRDDDGAGHAELARGPGHPLAHVPRARRDDAVGELAWRNLLDRVQGAPQLEGANRLEVLELEVDLGRSFRKLEPDERRPQHGPRDPFPRRGDLVEGDHSWTRWPVPVSVARR